MEPPLISTPPPPLGVPPIRKHPKLGIAGFVLAISAVFLECLMLFWAFFLGIRYHGHPEATTLWAAVLGASSVLILGTVLVALVLSIISLFDRSAKRVLGVSGLVVSALTLACLGGMATLSASRMSKLRRSGRVVTTQARNTAPPEPAQSPPPGPAPLASNLPPVWQIADNDHALVAISAVAGVAVDPSALARLRSAIEQKIADKKSENPPGDVAKQFLIKVRVQKYGHADSGSSEMKALNLEVDVRIFPGQERVCYFIVEELGEPRWSYKVLEAKAVLDAANCLANPRMWIRPEMIPLAPDEARHNVVPQQRYGDT